MSSDKCNISFDSYFTELVTDDNDESVSDLNAGIDTLFKMFNDNADSLSEEQLYLIRSVDENLPYQVAKNSTLNSQSYWWWILLLNRLEDPLAELKVNWAYAINSSSDINELIQEMNSTTNNSSNQRIGSVVELN